MNLSAHLAKLVEARKAAADAADAVIAERDAILEAVEARGDSDLTDEETVTFRAKLADVKAAQAKVEDLDTQIREVEEDIERSGRLDARAKDVAKATAKVEVTNEAVTYERGNGKSYVQDMLARAFSMGDDESNARLASHAREMRALNRTDGSGGFLIPPKWLMDRFIELARPGRVYANLVPTEALPPGTDSISIPKINTGTATAIQTADNANIQETDLTDTSVSCGVKTIAGAQALSIQALEQSPLNFDEIIFRDLAGDYANKLNLQVISGSNSGNQVKGVRNATGITTVTATDAGSQLQKVKTLYAKLADAIQQVHTQRFMAPEVIVMHPRRWAAIQSVFGANDTPLLGGSTSASTPVIGTHGGVISAGYVGNLHGLPVYTDPLLPTNLGAGTNEDVVHVLRASDLLLFESSVRTRTLDQTRADGLTILLQVYGFLAFTAERNPKSVVEIGGTALTAPTF
ncbi:major capsid protein [Mycobacterium phage WXIN]|nr:major capsid protein [Mycobacterium phage WXIN]